ncbi:MAG: hypothetical protein ABI330_06225, partial [Caldimonas sp.]
MTEHLVPMRRLSRLLRLLGLSAAFGLCLAACSPISLGLTAAGVATDTSMTWEIVKHLHAKLTEDDPTPCALLNSVQRVLNARCEYQPGSIKRSDFAKSGLQECPLALATRDPRLWRALPELLDKGASISQCPGSPLVALADNDPCPAFQAASPEVLKSITTLAESDPRAIRHDVFRMLSCSNARAAGLDHVLTTWLDRGDLDPAKLSFSPLSAVDPDLLVTRFGHELEVAGHKPEAALDGYDGALPSGFEEALRRSNWAALEWWLYRLPELANLAPPQRGGQLAWVPLQRVLLPGYLEFPSSQRDMVSFLLSHGSNPYQKLPFDQGKSVLAFAAQMKSPLLPLLDPRPLAAAPAAALAAAEPAPLLQTTRGLSATPSLRAQAGGE